MEPGMNFVDKMLEECLDSRTPVKLYMSNGYQANGLVEDFDWNYIKIRNKDGVLWYVNRAAVSTYEPYQGKGWGKRDG